METIQFILKYFICFGGFFILSWLAKSNDGNKLIDDNGAVRNQAILIGLQIGGIIWLGVIPFFIFKHSLGNVIFGNAQPQLLSLFIFIALTIAVVFVAIMQSNKTAKEFQDKEANVIISNFVIRYSIVRFIFLCVYEIFFRGFLLNDSIDQFGIALAITINIILYVLIHIFSGKKEIIGCIPFGLALCTVAILFKAVWPAIVLHLALSFTYEINCLKKIRQENKKKNSSILEPVQD